MKKSVLAFWMGVGLVLGSTNVAARVADCGPQTAGGDQCRIDILKAHPTQFAVGEVEVQMRSSKLKNLTPKELDKYVRKNLIPAVIGPDHVFYITDHHHLTLALLDAGAGSVILDVQKDWSNLSVNEFWIQMANSSLTYLYDEFGNGPLPYNQLPIDVQHMADDPYRSLAWGVQKAGGFESSTLPYASFEWANYFRARIARDKINSDFDHSVTQGVALAQLPDARGLPGYKGN